jgi:uncharacterized protein YndB with AHSA1/START domain
MKEREMASLKTHVPDPTLDLLLERVVDVPKEVIWRAWTTPELIKIWFTPAPWKTVECEIDLQPGGVFRSVMQSPEGENFPNAGCFLEVVENERLTWTNALLPGFRPNSSAEACPGEQFLFTATISLQTQGTGTKYTALVQHPDAAGRAKHEAMGFHAGWGAALDQLVAMAKQL